jgi:hypothetical protein
VTVEKHMVKEPDFTTVKQTVLNEVLTATNTYGLLTSLIFRLYNQRQLRLRYPFIINSLYRSVTGHVIMTVCRLFDPDTDRRHVSLSNFLRRVRSHHENASSLSPEFREKRLEFEAQIPERLEEIKAGWTPLATYRNAYLAHRDLTKSGPADFTFADLRKRIEMAQQIIGEYALAYENASQVFEVLELEREPEEFMRWCRLDDYERHLLEDIEKRKEGVRKSTEGRGD